MLTAANKTTKKSQEVLVTDNGELMTSPAECEARRVTSSSTLLTGPCRLVGATLISGGDAAILTIESGAEVKLKMRVLANWSDSVILPLPASCPGNLTVTLSGTNPEAIVYYSPA